MSESLSEPLAADTDATESDPPFGTYAPNAFQALIVRLTRQLPDTWFKRRLAFVLRRLVVMPLSRPLDVEVFGRRMRLEPFNNVAEKRILFTPQYFDAEERALLAERADDGFVFLDIGANIGGYALFVAGLGVGARVIAIEPQPELFRRLTYNISLNRDGPVKAIACALADKDGEMTLFLNAGNKGESSLKMVGWESDHGESLQVPTKTLLTLAREEGLERIDAVKIDIEGAEDLVLAPFFAEAPESLWPKLIIMENERGRWRVDCVELCLENGYRLTATTRNNVILER
ncbi:MAG TPA: FkbM family methyltransferase [Hyphomicrobiales bacterium]|nr:FkbM family methyltransferase [Hyphomicrobiales bacterium]